MEPHEQLCIDEMTRLARYLVAHYPDRLGLGLTVDTVIQLLEEREVYRTHHLCCVHPFREKEPADGL